MHKERLLKHIIALNLFNVFFFLMVNDLDDASFCTENL